MAQRTKTIAITGGKGGTGKSTAAVLLANSFVQKGKKVILVDADVECPNDYLLLGQGLGKAQERVFADFPKLNKSKCQKCGHCMRVCRNNAVFQAPGQYPVFIKDLCSGCGACWLVCPRQAISTKKEEIGQIFFNQLSQNYYLITGLAKPALEETGPVVRELKKFVSNLAKKSKPDFILLDTAAGTHCPVIAALLGCDRALAVTEPTPMGAYDLNLILSLCQKLKVEAKVILNQADLGDKKPILKIVKKFKTKIEKEVPYSKKIVEAYAQGNLLNMNFNYV